MFYVYVLRCADNTLYCGYTTDVKRRLKEHNGVGYKSGAKYTSGRQPVELVFKRRFKTRSAAMSYEAKFKQLSRKEKEKIIANSILTV